MAEEPDKDPRKFWTNLSADQIVAVDVLRENGLKVWITIQTKLGNRQYYLGKTHLPRSTGVAFPFPAMGMVHAIFIVAVEMDSTENYRATGKQYSCEVQVGKSIKNYGYGFADDDLIFKAVVSDDGIYDPAQMLYHAVNPHFRPNPAENT